MKRKRKSEIEMKRDKGTERHRQREGEIER